MKLTLVSIYADGIKVSEFVNLRVHADGKVRIPYSDMVCIWENRTGRIIYPGTTITIGM